MQAPGAAIASRWDAGEAGCSQLVVGLRRRIDQLGPGELLELVTLDAGATADLDAWCRVTGHRLVSANHPYFVIQRRGG